MIWLIGTLLAVILILALALSKPVLFGMGIGYTRQRPKQTAFIILGLMVTTTVVAGAGILADSAAESFVQSEDQRWSHYDAYAHDVFGRLDVLDEVIALPQIAANIAEAHAFHQPQSFLYDDSGLGETQDLLLLSEEAKETLGITLGDNQIIVSKSFAKAGKLDVGATVHLDGTAQATRGSHAFVLQGLVTATNSPAGWIVAPTSDNVQLTNPGPVNTMRMEPSMAAYQLEIETPSGDFYRFVNEPIVYLENLNEAEGTWTFTTLIEGVNQPYSYEVATTYGGARVVGNWDGSIAEIGFKPTPVYGSPSILNLNEFELENPQYFFQFKDGVNIRQASQAIEDAVRERDGHVWVWHKSEDQQMEQDLIRFAANLTFLSMGGLSVISGVVLIAVLMGLLVEERKRALGTMRALGATRGNLTFIHVSEGSLYAIIAGAFGIVGGLLMAVFLLDAVGSVVDDSEAVVLSARPLAYLAAGAGSALLILAVIALSAYRVTKIDIATAIRGEEQDVRKDRPRAKKWAFIWTILGAFMLVLGFITGNGGTGEFGQSDQIVPGLSLGVTLGMAFLAIGLGPFFSKYVGRTAGLTIVALTLLVFTIASFQFLKVQTAWDGLSVMLRVIIVPISFGILVAYSKPLHDGIVSLATKFGGISALWDAALSNIRNKHGRNAMTIAVLGSVLMGITAMGALFETYSVSNDGDLGGYYAYVLYQKGDLNAARADSGVSVDPASVSDFISTSYVSSVNIFGIDLDSTSFVFSEISVAATPELVSEQKFKFASKQGDPWQKVLDGTGVILGTGVVDYEDGAYRVGEQVALNEGGSLEVVGILQNVASIQAFVGPQHMPEFAGGFSLIKAEDVDYALRVWESAYRSLGADGVHVQQVVNDEARSERVIQTFLFSFMGLGIVIGMISLGLTTTRNVLMRRNEIGVLRAIGAKVNDVVTIFSLETAYITTFSIVLGLAGGITAAYAFVGNLGDLGYEVKLNWGLMATLYGFTLLAAATATIIPARIASKVEPAEAVRYE